MLHTHLGGVMETTQILLIIGGAAVLMILFKLLFGASRQPRAASPAMPASIAEAGKRMGSVAKQAEIFAEVSTLLVNRTTLERSEEHTSELQSLMRISY